MEQNSQNEKSIDSSRFKRFFAERWERIKSMKGKDWLNFFLNNALIFVLLIFLIVVAVIANVKNGVNLFSISNIIFIIEGSAKAVFLALGVGGIIILTGTDLSAGRVVGFTAILSAALLQPAFSETSTVIFAGVEAFPLPVVVLIVMIIGGIIGFINGFFVARFKLHPFIVTLSTSLVVFGFANIIAFMGNRAQVQDTIPAYGSFYDFSIPLFGNSMRFFVFIAIAAIILTWFLWNYTKFGKNMYAVGCNPEAATVSGISVSKTIILVFMYAGVLYGFAGFLEGAAGSGTSADAIITGANFELWAIAACVIGGVSFTGGTGKISGIVIGVLVFTCLDIGLSKIDFSGDERNIFKGAIILFAVTLDMRKYIVKR